MTVKRIILFLKKWPTKVFYQFAYVQSVKILSPDLSSLLVNHHSGRNSKTFADYIYKFAISEKERNVSFF